MNKKDIEALYQLSPAQQGMLFETLAAPNSGIYIEQSICPLQGNLNESAFTQAWQQVIQRHSVLRTSFVWQDRAEPLQVVLKEVPVSIDRQDLRGLTADEQQARLDSYLTADRRNGFKVTRPPLMRLALFQMADDQYQLVWTHHHILMDGWCLSLILQDFLTFYQAEAVGTPLHLDTPRPYGDYIRWLNQQDDRKARHFWQQKLQGFVQPTPLGKPGQATADKGSADFHAHLSHELSEALNRLARQHRLTPNIVIQGIWALLLSRYSGQSDVVFGTTVSGRTIDIEGAQSMIGLFMNTLPVRVRLSPDQAFWTWLQEIQTTNLELREYEATPGSLIHEASELPTSLPLYESILVFENYQFGDDVLSAAGLSLDIPHVRFVGGQTRFPLTLLVMPGAKMSFKFIYDRQRLEMAAVAQMFEHLQAALNHLVSRPEPVVADLLNLIPAAEIPVVRNASRQISEQQVPRTPVEQLVASIWKDVLGLETIGIHDNFFELGGHSLLATQLMARMRDAFQVDIPMRSLFTAPTVAGLAEMIAQSQDETPLDSLPTIIPDPAHRDLPFPLNDVQQAYWIGRSNTLELGNVSCHGYMEFDCVDLDLDRMNQAWQQLIARHDMLRAIVLPDGQQRILQNIPAYVIDVLDLREQDAVTVEEELLQVRNELSHQVLPSDRWPLFDIRATRIDEHHLRLHVSVDMLIADARSFQILLKELAYLYENPGAALSPLELSFRDYVLAEHALQETDVYKRSLAYWQQRLDTLPPGPELPLAIAPDSIQQPHFVRRSGKLEPAAWQQLKTRAQQAGLTPSGVLLAVYAEVLTNWSKSPRFTINLTLFNRLPLHTQVNDIFGDFTSLTLLEVNNSDSHPFAERARRLQEQLWNDLDHRHVGGIRVQRELMRSQGGASRTLMPVVFTSTLTLDDSSENTTPAWLGEMVYGIGQTPQIWLDHLVSEEAGALVYNWDAVEELFPAGMLDAMFEAYSRFLVRLAYDDQSWQDTLRQLTPAEQLAQRAEVNATEGPISNELLHTLFIAQTAKTPDRVAVVSPSCTLTYDELLRRSNQIGRYLRQHGAHPNSVVAVVMEKGWEQIVAVMGILQAGAAYVPIDATVPVERLHYLLQHSQATLALSQSHYDLEWPEDVHHVAVDSDAFDTLDDSPLDITQQPGDLAYIIFTSGSTGLPKGVVIDHRGAVNTILDMNQRFHVTAEDRVLALSALNFDLSVYDIFGLLAVGGTIVLPDAALQREPAHWAQLVERHQITLWNTVPALMNMLVEYQTSRHASLPESLRLVLMSGDWIPLSLPDRIRALAPQAELISLGGATEASIWSILYPISDVDLNWKSIPYGKPMINQSFEVLDDHLEPRPIWVPGSLFIGGIGLAQCYWRDDEKTNRSFIIHPQTGQRLYRTGDLGRYLPDGNIEFLGREDFQVKVQGYRIELGEIETALDQHPDIRSAVVTAVGERHADKRLVAYLVLENEQSIDTDALRVYLKTKLPEYMVPSVFMLMDSLPLTSNGKVNRKALPAPDTANLDGNTFVAPRTEVEITLCQISAQILSVTQMGIHDNFFALGGNSVQATQLVSRLRETFQIEFPVRSIFEAPSVAQLAEKIEAALWSQQRAAVPAGAEMEEGEI